MKNSKYYPLALEALVELAPEIAAAQSNFQPVRSPSHPSLEDVLDRLGLLPSGSLLLGMANDGLPVLLNLYDPSPGSILLIGDPGSGKTTLLKTLALTIARLYEANDVQFSVTTSATESWGDMEGLPNCAGICSINGNDARELVASLFDWAHQNNKSQQVVLFLVDDLGKTSQWDETAKSQLRWLLMRGPSRRIWPILTLNPLMIADVKEWLPLFRTFIYGKISNPMLSGIFTGASNAHLDTLQGGTEFSMKEGNHWLKFWIPGI